MSSELDLHGSLLSLPLKTLESDKRPRVLLSAEEIISHNGRNRSTGLEITRKGRVNDSAVNKYFKGE